MWELTIKHVDAFTTEPFCGNPAGVIEEADGLTADIMQRIASEMSLAETAFILQPTSRGAVYRIRFFTPSEELDLSGHATIASCFALIENGKVPLHDGKTTVYFETNIGNVPVDIYFKEGLPGGEPGRNHADGMILEFDGGEGGMLERIMMHQPIQCYRPSTLPIKEIAGILGIDESEIIGTGLPVEIISTGLDQTMVPVRHKETILDMNPDLIKLALMNKRFGIHTNHIFTLDTFHTDCVAYSRHFGPAVGLWEDPAAGTASAALGTYLVRHGGVTSGSMIMEQGKTVESLARIFVEVDQTESDVNSARVGGLAVTSLTRRIDIEKSGRVLSK